MAQHDNKLLKIVSSVVGVNDLLTKLKISILDRYKTLHVILTILLWIDWIEIYMLVLSVLL